MFQLLQPAAAEVQRVECLRSLREITTSLAERPARGDLTGEVCHWADGYPLNVRLYEKMLSSVFDILDEGKLTEVLFDSTCEYQLFQRVLYFLYFSTVSHMSILLNNSRRLRKFLNF